MRKKTTTYGQQVRLQSEERNLVYDVQRDSQVDALTARRARILELLAEGTRPCEVADSTGAGIATVGRTRRRFLEEGLDAALWG